MNRRGGAWYAVGRESTVSNTSSGNGISVSIAMLLAIE